MEIKPEEQISPKIQHKTVIERARDSGDSLWKYMLAANASGVGTAIALAVGIIIGIISGFWWHSNLVKEREAKVNSIVEEHATLKYENDDLKDANANLLRESLRDLGFKDAEIAVLNQTTNNLIDKLKNQAVKYLPGKTVYVPRSDCGPDYLGTEDADLFNTAIRKGVETRARNND